MPRKREIELQIPSRLDSVVDALMLECDPVGADRPVKNRPPQETALLAIGHEEPIAFSGLALPERCFSRNRAHRLASDPFHQKVSVLIRRSLKAIDDLSVPSPRLRIWRAKILVQDNVTNLGMIQLETEPLLRNDDGVEGRLHYLALFKWNTVPV